MKKNTIFLIVVMCILSVLPVIIIVGLLTNSFVNKTAITSPEISANYQLGSIDIFTPTYDSLSADSLYAESLLGANKELILQQLQWQWVDDEDNLINLTWEEMQNYTLSEYPVFLAEGSGDYEGLAAIISYDEDLSDVTMTWKQCEENNHCIMFLSMDINSPAANTILQLDKHDDVYNAILAQFGNPFTCDADSSGETVLIYAYDKFIATIGILNSDEGGGIDITMLTGYADE